MGLNIKNPRVHELAREAARRTGSTQTAAIEAALDRYLQSLPGGEGSTRSTRLVEWFESWADLVDDESRAGMDAAEADLYDEAGLPR